MRQKVVITGGAGFIGSNLTEFFLQRGDNVVVYDNLSRPGGGASANIRYMLEKHKDNPHLGFIEADILDLDRLSEVVRDAGVVLHVAAQTAMTTSLDCPVADFETNARGTFNVLESARMAGSEPVVVYTSTNKVYGELSRNAIQLEEKGKRWDFAAEVFKGGVDESCPLDYEGPYGCSKGTGDAYCLDYARTFGIRTVVFRMSGIYGPSQHPTEDQAWVAWFLRRAIENEPITIYGDGKQVRDILYIADLVDAFARAIARIDDTRGQVYNIGGGRENAISVLELLEYMDTRLNIRPSEVRFGPWRTADQKVYISNTARAERDFGWRPKVNKEEGIARLYKWMKKA